MEISLKITSNQLEEQINGYTNMNQDYKIVYQLFELDMSDALIIAIVTPLMREIYTEVLGWCVYSGLYY